MLQWLLVMAVNKCVTILTPRAAHRFMDFYSCKWVVSFLEFISFKLEKILKQFFEDAGG